MGNALLFVTLFSGIIPLLLLLQKPVKPANAVLLLAGLIFFASFYELIFSVILQYDSTIWFRIYLLLEFMAIYYFFSKLFANRFKYVFRIYAIVYITLWMYLWSIWNSETSLETDVYLTIAESIFVYTFAVFWFKELFNKAVVESLLQTPEFYFICGLIFYFSGTVFLFLLSGSMLKSSHISFEDYWLVNVMVSLVLRILLIIGIWKAQQKLRQFFG